tara:strand:- start:50 stop:355 length:306 start_codon:yes stop_codon:yes gene_type:complete
MKEVKLNTQFVSTKLMFNVYMYKRFEGDRYGDNFLIARYRNLKDAENKVDRIYNRGGTAHICSLPSNVRPPKTFADALKLRNTIKSSDKSFLGENHLNTFI